MKPEGKPGLSGHGLAKRGIMLVKLFQPVNSGAWRAKFLILHSRSKPAPRVLSPVQISSGPNLEMWA
jgi:hypothetical protein